MQGERGLLEELGSDTVGGQGVVRNGFQHGVFLESGIDAMLSASDRPDNEKARVSPHTFRALP
ncbi:hypothetical protein D3C87_1928740 [compost metagenome]